MAKIRTTLKDLRDAGVMVLLTHQCGLSKSQMDPENSLLQVSPNIWGFPGGASGKEPACHCRRCKRHWFDLWASKIPWRRAWQPTPVSLPGESIEQRSLVGDGP